MLLGRSTKSFLAVSAKFSVFFCVCDEDFACLDYLELSEKTFCLVRNRLIYLVLKIAVNTAIECLHPAHLN